MPTSAPCTTSSGRFPDAARQYEEALAFAASDQQVVGLLADALWLIPGRRPEAVRLYEKAAHLAEESLKVNPVDAQVIASTRLLQRQDRRHRRVPRAHLPARRR